MGLEPLVLEPEVLTHLLNPVDPVLRARVLADLLWRPPGDPDRLEAESRVLEQPWIRETLAAHHGDGTWGRGLTSGYEGTIWTLFHLSELGAPAHAEAVRKGVEVLLSQAKRVDKIRGRRALLFEGCEEGVYWEFPTACFTARAATSLVRFGYLNHPVTQGALSTCKTLFDAEEGFGCFVMDDSLLPACFMSVPAVLKLFLAIPEENRTAEDEGFIKEMAGLLKKRHLYRYVARDSREWVEWGQGATAAERREESPRWLAEGRAEPRREKAGWLRFGFPHSYNSDLLEVVLLLGEVDGNRDEVIEEGLRIILSKRDEEGMWKMATGLNGKMNADLDTKGEPSPWVTYRALLAFKRFGLLAT